MTHAAVLATRYARRPLLLEPTAARELVGRLQLSDPRGMLRESRLDAVLRKVGVGRPRAMEDGDEFDVDANPVRTPAAYAPLWARQAYGDPSDEGFAWSLYNGVAMMEVATAISDRGEYFCGTWYHGYDTILAAMREAMAHSQVRALFVRMCTPGGVVAGGLPALAAFMRANRAAAGGKPIYVYADMACSAGYWIAAQADQVWSPRVGLVGSIGAVLVHAEFSGFYKQNGITVTPIQFGAEKTAGADWAPLSATAKADLQAEIDQCGADFVADVALGRPQLTAEALIATEARVYLASNDDAERSGLAIGFVDALGSEEEAFEALLASLPELSTGPAAGFPLSASSPAREGGLHALTEAKMNISATELARLRGQHAEIGRQIASAEAAAAGETTTTAEPGAAMPPKDDEDAEDAADGGDDEAAEGEKPGEDDAEDQDNKKPPSSEAEAAAAASRDAILASPEAQAQPHLALAAVRDGLTLAQFKGQLAAQAQAPQRGALAAAMEGARRLGPDASKPGTGGESLLVTSAKKIAGAK